jgi:hypothetical protein
MTPREQIIALIGEAALTALESSGYIVRPREATDGMEKAAAVCLYEPNFPSDVERIDTAMTEAWEKEQNDD